MRNSFTYYGFNNKILLNILLNISKDIEYISVLVSNYNTKTLSLPKDYINYDIIAGIGCIDLINSKKNSFEKHPTFITIDQIFALVLQRIISISLAKL